jgi:hypothetical protein
VAGQLTRLGCPLLLAMHIVRTPHGLQRGTQGVSRVTWLLPSFQTAALPGADQGQSTLGTGQIPVMQTLVSQNIMVLDCVQLLMPAQYASAGRVAYRVLGPCL